jgi:hypothetical protein
MADFVAPQISPPPDMLAAYMRGAMAPWILQEQRQQLQAGQQGLETGAINLDMLRYMVGFRKQAMDEYQQGDDGSGGQPPQPLGQGGLTAGAQAQSGPQGAAQPSTDPLARNSINRDAQYARTMAYINGTDPNAPMAVADKLNADILQHQNEVKKLQAAPREAEAENIVTSPDPARLLMGNPNYMAGWKAFAPMIADQNGKPLDPLDHKNMTPENIRVAATMARNQIRATYGGEPLPMPAGYRPMYGPNGQFGQMQVGGKEGSGSIKELSQQQPPGYTPEISTDFAGHKTAAMLQTKPGGAPAFGGPGVANGSMRPSVPSGVGSVAGAGIPVGNAPPTPETNSAATVADAMRTGMQSAIKMEQGPKPVRFSPYEATLILNGISSEGGGSIVPGYGALSEYLSEKGQSNLSPEKQQYLAAVLPMVEAKITGMPRERVNEGTIKAAFDQLVPRDTTDAAGMAQINQNRESTYRSRLGAAGQSATTPLQPGLQADFAAYSSGSKPSWLDSAKPQYQEGQVARHPNQPPLVFKGGQWVPYSGK